MRVYSDWTDSLHFASYPVVVVDVVCNVLYQHFLWVIGFGDPAFCCADDFVGVRFALRDTFER